jgi:hypothetical protein
MTRSFLALGFVAMLGVPLAATANPLTGVLNITGTANISSSGIAFNGGLFSVNGPASSQQGGFTALAGTTGRIDNITNPPGALDVPLFMTFSIAPNITITLTFLEPGLDGAAGCSSAPPAGGQICTPAQSLFDLTNLSGTSSTASFAILGVEQDSLTNRSVPMNGVFTIPFSDQSFQDLLATVNGGGTVTASFSGQFTTTDATSSTPEPGTLLMSAIGIMGLGGSRFARSIARNSREDR